MGDRQGHPSGAEAGTPTKPHCVWRCAQRREVLFVPLSDVPADLQLCSQKEQEFAQEYNASLDRYMNDIGLDLTSDQTPPRGMFIDVLAMEDVGTIVTDSGMSMTLKKVRAVARRTV